MFFFFVTQTYPLLSQKSRRHRHPYVNEKPLAETDEAYSNTQDGTSSENSNVVDLPTVFTKSPIPDT